MRRLITLNNYTPLKRVLVLRVVLTRLITLNNYTPLKRFPDNTRPPVV